MRTANAEEEEEEQEEEEIDTAAAVIIDSAAVSISIPKSSMIPSFHVGPAAAAGAESETGPPSGDPGWRLNWQHHTNL